MNGHAMRAGRYDGTATRTRGRTRHVSRTKKNFWIFPMETSGRLLGARSLSLSRDRSAMEQIAGEQNVRRRESAQQNNALVPAWQLA
jgi:hypothetical protein